MSAASPLPEDLLEQLRAKMDADRQRHLSGNVFGLQPVPAALPISPASPPRSSAPAPSPSPSPAPAARPSGPRIVRQRSEPEIICPDYPLIPAGEYEAVSSKAHVYFDRQFHRHVCLVRFNISTPVLKVDSGISIVGSTAAGKVKIPWYLNLGDADQPRAGRRSLYWSAWHEAKRGQGEVRQTRRDRLSPRIFENRAARVLVGDTTQNYCGADNFSPYSIIKKVLTWNTQ